MALDQAKRTTNVHKYRAKPQTLDGIRFDSTKESLRYLELKTMQKANLIRALKIHPRYPIEVQGRHIAFYEADFFYFDCEKQRWIIEDCKGMKSGAAYQMFKLKKKLIETLYTFEILET
jgi:hypothetical protein